HVTPDDVRAMVPSVLGHRFSLSYDALADGVDHQRVVQELLDCVEIG
ncbi:AAA family ATPase, partial [Vibrio campbellii]